jgi:hypothetical protein
MSGFQNVLVSDWTEYGTYSSSTHAVSLAEFLRKLKIKSAKEFRSTVASGAWRRVGDRIELRARIGFVVTLSNYHLMVPEGIQLDYSKLFWDSSVRFDQRGPYVCASFPVLGWSSTLV